MNVGALLQSAIYIISSSMLYPAMFLLTAGFMAVVAASGAAVADWAERSRLKDIETRYSHTLQRLDSALEQPGASWSGVEDLWKTVTLENWKKLDYLRVLARLEPAMGLVGTLIPMSTGLASLTQGDASRLSSDLVVAFSTTVVGLCSGVAAYVLHTVRSRWVEEDLQALRIAMESRASKRLGGETPR